MRIALLTLLLIGCASQPERQLTLDPYVCYIYNGTVDDVHYLVRWHGDYSSKEEALREANEIQAKLMYKGVIPITSEGYCKNEGK